MVSGPKLVRIQEKGQVTLPVEVRKQLGLKKGDLVAVTATPEGALITPQEIIATVTVQSLVRGGDEAVVPPPHPVYPITSARAKPGPSRAVPMAAINQQTCTTE